MHVIYYSQLWLVSCRCGPQRRHQSTRGRVWVISTLNESYKSVLWLGWGSFKLAGHVGAWCSIKTEIKCSLQCWLWMLDGVMRWKYWHFTREKSSLFRIVHLCRIHKWFEVLAGSHTSLSSCLSKYVFHPIWSHIIYCGCSTSCLNSLCFKC